ncbi:hypothetical protein B7P43_G12318 [Cryptotermes secundus]|uniref:Tc1-like transposase DDE domain-containing protein n=1 Tax=Cryptotermes secundus TaxID=105785 RepID=A0A2J7RL17_9NEOP|nr:hypothetical protein B7P43_G12318 [Cryptotermes secundus]
MKNTQGSLQSGRPSTNSETRGRFCGGLGSNIVIQYSVGPIMILHGQIAAREYLDRLGNQVHPMIQTSFPQKDAVSQDDNVPIHTAGTVQLWFEEHEGELQHLPWSAQPQDLNITEPLWSVLETKLRNRFLPPTPLKHLEDVLQEEWYRILLETVKNLYESIPRRISPLLRQKVVQHHIDKEMCTISVVPPLFCPTSVYSLTAQVILYIAAFK